MFEKASFIINFCQSIIFLYSFRLQLKISDSLSETPDSLVQNTILLLHASSVSKQSCHLNICVNVVFRQCISALLFS